MRGESGVYEWLVIGIFAVANAIIGAIFIGTVWVLVREKFFPQVLAPVVQESKTQ